MLEICWAAMTVQRAQLNDFSRKGERGRVHVGRLGFSWAITSMLYRYIYVDIFMTSACQVVTPPLVVRYNSKTDQPPT